MHGQRRLGCATEARWFQRVGRNLPGCHAAPKTVSDDMDLQPHRHPAPRSEARPPAGIAAFRLTGRIPPVLSVALVGVIVGLLVGIGFGYRLGAPAPTPPPRPSSPPPPTATPADLVADSVSPRLEMAFESTAPAGWAVCGLGEEPTCHQLISATTDLPREPEIRYGEGWYSNRILTGVTVAPAHEVVAASTGDGSVLAYLNRIGPGDSFLKVVDLTPVSPGRRGQFYFDLGDLVPGHYVVQVDFIPVPPAESAGTVTFYIVGFIVS